MTRRTTTAAEVEGRPTAAAPKKKKKSNRGGKKAKGSSKKAKAVEMEDVSPSWVDEQAAVVIANDDYQVDDLPPRDDTNNLPPLNEEVLRSRETSPAYGMLQSKDDEKTTDDEEEAPAVPRNARLSRTLRW